MDVPIYEAETKTVKIAAVINGAAAAQLSFRTTPLVPMRRITAIKLSSAAGVRSSESAPRRGMHRPEGRTPDWTLDKLETVHDSVILATDICELQMLNIECRSFPAFGSLPLS
ncbi:MAG: hypothetical protein GY862_18615 [Gammaproteobacteria bacterium]|nr:hypothetical protein [Gammaproteobacteria bacterium]